MRPHRTVAALLVAVLTAGCARTAAAPGEVVGSGRMPRQPALTACPSAAPGAAADLPDLTLSCMGPGAERLRLRALGGGPVLVNLWASWCAPCQEEMPALQRAWEDNRPAVLFVGIDVKDSADSALDFLAEVGVTYPQLSDPDGEALHAFGGSGLPVTVALDAQGKVVYQRRGILKPDDLRQALNAVRATG